MNGNYLIPANTKDGQLILNMFKPVDLALAIIACAEILLALVIMNNSGDTEPEWYTQMLAISPGIILLILVVKIPYYHNVRTLLYDIYSYYSNQHSFKWRGWYKNVTK